LINYSAHNFSHSLDSNERLYQQD